jgi:hypothetical protein
MPRRMNALQQPDLSAPGCGSPSGVHLPRVVTRLKALIPGPGGGTVDQSYKYRLTRQNPLQNIITAFSKSVT